MKEILLQGDFGAVLNIKFRTKKLCKKATPHIQCLHIYFFQMRCQRFLKPCVCVYAIKKSKRETLSDCVAPLQSSLWGEWYIFSNKKGLAPWRVSYCITLSPSLREVGRFMLIADLCPHYFMGHNNLCKHSWLLRMLDIRGTRKTTAIMRSVLPMNLLCVKIWTDSVYMRRLYRWNLKAWSPCWRSRWLF